MPHGRCRYGGAQSPAVPVSSRLGEKRESCNLQQLQYSRLRVNERDLRAVLFRAPNRPDQAAQRSTVEVRKPLQIELHVAVAQPGDGFDQRLNLRKPLLNPEWSPDGTRLLSVESRQHPWHLIWRRVGDGTLPRRLTPGTGRPSWAPDGRTIAFARSGSAGATDIWTIELSSAGQAGTPTVLINGAGNQQAPRFSPDGRFLAYESDQSGRPEIYVQRLPLTPQRWVVSRDGGSAPRWSRSGPELFFRARDGRVMAVAVTLGAAFRAAEPQALFSETAVPGSMSREFDVAADGQRFLVVARAPGHTSRIVVVQNWLREFEPQRP